MLYPTVQTLQTYVASEEAQLLHRERIVASGRADPGRPPFSGSIYDVPPDTPISFNVFFRSWVDSAICRQPSSDGEFSLVLLRTYPRPETTHLPHPEPLPLLVSPTTSQYINAFSISPIHVLTVHPQSSWCIRGDLLPRIRIGLPSLKSCSFPSTWEYTCWSFGRPHLRHSVNFPGPRISLPYPAAMPISTLSPSPSLLQPLTPLDYPSPTAPMLVNLRTIPSLQVNRFLPSSSYSHRHLRHRTYLKTLHRVIMRMRGDLDLTMGWMDISRRGSG